MDETIKTLFDSYPTAAKKYLMQIRSLLYDLAEEESLGEITESLKWGEPSYRTKQGSPIRMDWKAKRPEAISIYFNCKTKLIETFKELHGESLLFEGNREIVLLLDRPLPIAELENCLSMAFRYHDIKNLPLLGA